MIGPEPEQAGSFKQQFLIPALVGIVGALVGAILTFVATELAKDRHHLSVSIEERLLDDPVRDDEWQGYYMTVTNDGDFTEENLMMVINSYGNSQLIKGPVISSSALGVYAREPIFSLPPGLASHGRFEGMIERLNPGDAFNIWMVYSDKTNVSLVALSNTATAFAEIQHGPYVPTTPQPRATPRMPLPIPEEPL